MAHENLKLGAWMKRWESFRLSQYHFYHSHGETSGQRYHRELCRCLNPARFQNCGGDHSLFHLVIQIILETTARRRRC